MVVDSNLLNYNILKFPYQYIDLLKNICTQLQISWESLLNFI